MNRDVYLLATRIQSLCGMDQYKDPPRHEGVTHAIVALLREWWKDDSIESERDHFKVECAHREMEEHRLKDVITALKAELDSTRAKDSYVIHNMKAEISKLKVYKAVAESMEIERDKLKAELEATREKAFVQWKELSASESRAAKYREALEKIVNIEHGCDKGDSEYCCAQFQTADIDAQEALKEAE